MPISWIISQPARQQDTIARTPALTCYGERMRERTTIPRCRSSVSPASMRNIESDSSRRCVGYLNATSTFSTTCSGYRPSAHEFRPARCAARTRSGALGLGFEEAELDPAVRPVHAVVRVSQHRSPSNAAFESGEQISRVPRVGQPINHADAWPAMPVVRQASIPS